MIPYGDDEHVELGDDLDKDDQEEEDQKETDAP